MKVHKYQKIKFTISLKSCYALPSLTLIIINQNRLFVVAPSTQYHRYSTRELYKHHCVSDSDPAWTPAAYKRM